MKLQIYLLGVLSLALWLIVITIGAYLAVVFGYAFITVAEGTVSAAPGFYAVLCLLGCLLLISEATSLYCGVKQYRQAHHKGDISTGTSCMVATLWVFYMMLIRPWVRIRRKM